MDGIRRHKMGWGLPSPLLRLLGFSASARIITLTQQGPDYKSSRRKRCDSLPGSRAMIDAGVDILMDFDWGWSNPRQYAVRIYRAMASRSV